MGAVPKTFGLGVFSAHRMLKFDLVAFLMSFVRLVVIGMFS